MPAARAPLLIYGRSRRQIIRRTRPIFTRRATPLARSAPLTYAPGTTGRHLPAREQCSGDEGSTRQQRKEARMRNVLALIGLLVIGFGGLGWYLGWYKLSYSRTPDGHLQVTTDVDTKKVGADSQEFIKNASTVVEKAAQDAKTPAGAPGSTPGPVVPPGTATPPIPLVPVAPV